MKPRSSWKWAGFRPALETLEDRSVPSATTVVFLLDPAHSQVNVSGTVSNPTVGTLDLQPQQAGSLTTALTGKIDTSIDLAAHKISFVASGTSLVAPNAHAYSPGVNGADGTAPASIGGFVSGTIAIFSFRVDAALRDITGTLSTAKPLTLSSASSPTFASTQTMALTKGAVDYRPSGAAAMGLTPGRSSLAGKHTTNQASHNGKLTSLGGGMFKITVPLHLTLSTTSNGTTFTLTLDGSVTGTSNFKPVITGPTTTQTTMENKALVFSKTNHNALSLSDKDGDTQKITLTAGHGKLKLSHLTGLTVMGNGTGTVTASGSIASLNAALNGLTLTPNRGFTGSDTVRLSDRDANGGTAKLSVKVTVTAPAAPARKSHHSVLLADYGTFPAG